MPERADDVDRKLLDAVERLGRALRAARQQVASALGLTILQTEILGRIGGLGPLPVGRLARELDIAQPTASDAITALERKRLVERVRHTDDGRLAVARLTDSGRSTAERITAELAPLYSDREHPDRTDRGVALSVLLDEILRLQRAGVITINRSCFSCRHYRPPVSTSPAHCLLLDTPLDPPNLRVDCPEHERQTADLIPQR